MIAVSLTLLSNQLSLNLKKYGCFSVSLYLLFMIKTVIFDIGGVLTFDIWEHLFLDAKIGIADKHNLSHEEVRSFASELWEQFAYRTASSEQELKRLEIDYWQRAVKRFALSDSLDNLINTVNQFIKPIDGMSALVAQLKAAGIELAICSNNAEFWFDKQLKNLPMLRLFKSKKIILSSRIGFPKASPKFEMFQAVLKNVNSKKEECLFIDDRIINIQNALSFGFAALLFPHEASFGAAYLSKIFEEIGLSKF